MEKVREEGVLLKKSGKGRGFLAKMPSSSSSRHKKQRRGDWGRRRSAPATQGAGVAGSWGKTESATRGSDSPSHLERRRHVAAWPQRPAAAGGGVRGSGAAGPGRELTAAVVLMVMGSGEEEPYYRPGEGGGEGAMVVAGGASSAPSFNGAWCRGGAIRGGTGTTRQLGQRRAARRAL